MGLRAFTITIALFSFLMISSFNPSITNTAQGQKYEDFPLALNVGKIDANYDQVQNNYHAGIDERVQVFFNVEIRNASSTKNPTVHVLAFMYGFARDSRTDSHMSIDTINKIRGDDAIRNYERTKDVLTSDYPAITFKELNEKKIESISVNLTFHTAGEWTIQVVFELSPGVYYSQGDMGERIIINQKNSDINSFSLFGLSFTFIILAIIADVIHRILTGRKRASTKKWWAGKKKTVAALISIFIVILLIFYSIFYVLFPKPSYVQIIGDMDGKVDAQGRIHVAWVKHIEQKYSSMDDMMRNFDYQGSVSGSLFYTKIDTNSMTTTTIPIELGTIASSVKLLLDSKGHPHIFWREFGISRNNDYAFSYVEVKPEGVGSIKSISCKHQFSNEIFVEIAKNDTFFVSGCNGLSAILPDGTTWNDANLTAASTSMDADGNLHMIGEGWKNDTVHIEHRIIDKNGNFSNTSLNISIPEHKWPSIQQIGARGDGDLFMIVLWQASSTNDIRIMRGHGNITNSTTIYSGDSYNAQGSFSTMSVIDDKVYGFYSGMETLNEKSWHLFYSENGTEWETKSTTYRVWNIVNDSNGRIYGLGQVFRYQPMSKDLVQTIMFEPIDWNK